MTLPLDFLVDGTLKQAVDYLAERAAKVRTEGHTWTEKKALGLSDIMTSVGDVAKDPIVGKALLGGGVGALAGGASHYMGNQDGTPESKRKGMLGSALTGALAGGALGGGIGAAQKYWPSMGGGGPKVPTDGPGVFTDLTTGKKFSIDPKYVADHPDMVAKIEAASKPTVPEKALNVVRGVKSTLAENAPFSLYGGGLLGLHDIKTMYQNARGMGRDPRMFMTGLEQIGKDHPMFATPERQAMIKNLMGGPDAAVERAKLLQNTNQGLFGGGRWFGGIRDLFSKGGLSGDKVVHNFTPPPTPGVPDAVKAFRDKVQTSGPASAGTLKKLDALIKSHAKSAPGLPATMSKADVRHVNTIGFRALREKNVMNKGLSTPARVFGYGLPMALDAAGYLGRGATEDKVRHETMAEMFKKMRAEGGLKPLVPAGK